MGAAQPPRRARDRACVVDDEGDDDDDVVRRYVREETRVCTKPPSFVRLRVAFFGSPPPSPAGFENAASSRLLHYALPPSTPLAVGLLLSPAGGRPPASRPRSSEPARDPPAG